MTEPSLPALTDEEMVETAQPQNGPLDPADVFIQWKGTDACFDFHCECGEDGHFDGRFAYGVKCWSCGTEYEMPSTVYPRKITDESPWSYPREPVIPYPHDRWAP